MTAYHRSDSMPYPPQALLVNGHPNSDMVYEDADSSSSSPATLSAPPTPRTGQSPRMTARIPACNDPTMTPPTPPPRPPPPPRNPPPFPDQQDSEEAFCEFVFLNGFQQGIVIFITQDINMDHCISFHFQGVSRILACISQYKKQSMLCIESSWCDLQCYIVDWSHLLFRISIIPT